MVNRFEMPVLASQLFKENLNVFHVEILFRNEDIPPSAYCLAQFGWRILKGAQFGDGFYIVNYWLVFLAHWIPTLMRR